MNKDDGALIFGHEQALSAEDAYNIYLEGRSQHVNSVLRNKGKNQMKRLYFV